MGLVRTDRDGIGFYTVSSFPAGALAVFSTRLGGISRPPYAALNVGAHVGDDPGAVAENRRRLATAVGLPEPWATVRQVHGSVVLRITAWPNGEPLGSADALITDRPGLPLAIFTADCAAVYIYDPVRRAVGLAHAGWRGTASAIAARTVAAMAKAYGTNPGDCYAAVSPAIGSCCYEVDEAVVSRLRHFPWLGRVIRETRPGHWRLDLWLANRLQLADAGLALERIAVSGLCTACHMDQFYSHRAEAGCTGRQVALLALK